MKIKSILRNAAICLQCNTELLSKSRFDLQTCKCGKLTIYGGKEELYRIGPDNRPTKEFQETSIFETISSGEWEDQEWEDK